MRSLCATEAGQAALLLTVLVAGIDCEGVGETSGLTVTVSQSLDIPDMVSMRFRRYHPVSENSVYRELQT